MLPIFMFVDFAPAIFDNGREIFCKRFYMLCRNVLACDKHAFIKPHLSLLMAYCFAHFWQKRTSSFGVKLARIRGLRRLASVGNSPLSANLFTNKPSYDAKPEKNQVLIPRLQSGLFMSSAEASLPPSNKGAASRLALFLIKI